MRTAIHLPGTESPHAFNFDRGISFYPSPSIPRYAAQPVVR